MIIHTDIDRNAININTTLTSFFVFIPGALVGLLLVPRVKPAALVVLLSRTSIESRLWQDIKCAVGY